MKFRKLYWVTEVLGDNGRSQVGGVYTSIHDLLERGLHWTGDQELQAGFRVTLVKLDSDKAPLGRWVSPDFAGMHDALQEYVATDEFNAQDCDLLLENLAKFAQAS
ncbi:MAG: hypothetical protein KF857_12095 [Fimbriimonadaceae bacterium]|nr:hypothetical protein [Fimbriimonadaceae bacterium]